MSDLLDQEARLLLRSGCIFSPCFAIVQFLFLSGTLSQLVDPFAFNYIPSVLLRPIRLTSIDPPILGSQVSERERGRACRFRDIFEVIYRPIINLSEQHTLPVYQGNGSRLFVYKTDEGKKTTSQKSNTNGEKETRDKHTSSTTKGWRFFEASWTFGNPSFTRRVWFNSISFHLEILLIRSLGQRPEAHFVFGTR